MVILDDIGERMHMTFDPWQREFILDENPRIILRNGRKTGKTHAAAVKIALDMMNERFSHTDGILITSKSLRNAKDILLLCRSILSIFGYKFGRYNDKEKDEHYASMTEVRLNNGNRVRAMACGFDGAGIRPYSFYKIFRDEDAWTPLDVDAAVNACLMVYGVQEIRASTPCGTGGSFWKAEESGIYKVYHVKTQECKFKDNTAFLLKERKRLGRVEYLQEYEAEYQDIADGIYPRWLIAATMMKEPEWAELEKTCDGVFMGVDYAHFGEDENVIAEAIVKDDIFHVRIKIISSKFRTTHVNGFIIAESRRLGGKLRLVVTDESGVGAGATDYLVAALGKRRVLGIMNQKRFQGLDELRKSNQRRTLKVDLHNNLIFMMENGFVRFDDDMDIHRSLTTMKFKYSLRGNLMIRGDYSHPAEAIVRACYAHMAKIKAKRNIFFGAIAHSELFKYQSENKF